jgi:hypothetical protein
MLRESRWLAYQASWQSQISDAHIFRCIVLKQSFAGIHDANAKTFVEFAHLDPNARHLKLLRHRSEGFWPGDRADYGDDADDQAARSTDPGAWPGVSGDTKPW